MRNAFYGIDGGRNSMPPVSATASENDILVQSISDSQWRVCDRRFPEHDAHHLLGFIERVVDRFEVMQVGTGFEWFQFDTLNSAIAHFTGDSTSSVKPT
ncbi:hypothetical protein AB4Y63_11995 [Leifsonia sp. YAF41]|uniref:hypothetical protein n=1 Tax=Leifsonia sp. YAF41 TaxID=3233086 RepID=UPI003F995C5C